MNDKSTKELQKLNIDNELTIHKLIESNLKGIFNLEFIDFEHRIHTDRGNLYKFDTLCFNKERNTFAVIEYKKSQTSGMIEQGKAYLNTIRKKKAEFVNNVNERCRTSFDVNQVDWNNLYVIYISSSYSYHQLDAVDDDSELWRYQLYEKNLLMIESIFSQDDRGDLNNQRLFKIGSDDKVEVLIKKSKKVIQPNEMVSDFLTLLQSKYENLFVHEGYDHYYITYGSKDGYEVCTIFNIEGGVRIRIYRGRQFNDRRSKNFVYINDLGDDVEKTYRLAWVQKLHYCFYQLKITDKKNFPQGIKLIEQRLSMLK